MESYKQTKLINTENTEQIGICQMQLVKGKEMGKWDRKKKKRIHVLCFRHLNDESG